MGEKMKRHCFAPPAVAALSVIALLTAVAPVAHADFITTYTIDLGTSHHLEHILAFDEGPGGFERITGLSDVTGPGNFTLVNPQPSSVPVNDFFLFGLSDLSGTYHVVMTMTPAGRS